MEDMSQMKSARGKMFVSFDLNNLKECNDEHGHVEGDTYLRNAARDHRKDLCSLWKGLPHAETILLIFSGACRKMSDLFCIEGMQHGRGKI